MSPTRAPYGTWNSPITSELITQSGVGLSQLRIDGEWIYWLETRPTEKNRTVVVRAPFGGTAVSEPEDVTTADTNVRTMVHEYGGGDFCVRNGAVYFSNLEDQRVYRLDTREGVGSAAQPRPLTPTSPAPAAWRYADGAASPDNAWLICVRERHVDDREPYNELVIISTGTGGDEPKKAPSEKPVGNAQSVRILAQGHDFFAEPRFRPDGRAIAWITWDHPNMPWDGTDLWMATFDPASGTIGSPVRVAGGRSESVTQPQWGPDGALYYTSDRTGWANLYGTTKSTQANLPEPSQARQLFEMEAEFAGPLWTFGNSNYSVLEDGCIAVVYAQHGLDHLGVLVPSHDDGSMRLVRLDVPFTHFGRSTRIDSDGRSRLASIAASPADPPQLCGIDIPSRTDMLAVSEAPGASGSQRSDAVPPLVTTSHRVLRRSSDTDLPSAFFSKPEPIEFPTENGLTAHALYYPPVNPEYEAPPGERPPLIVKSHGGPTSATSSQLELALQYWTSRGFAIVDVNYGGSTGYGRAYRQRLNGQWGIVDTMDCINAAKFLVRRGDADGNRLIVRGGSAGGYTTLCALTFHDVFAAGASYYGIGDLEALDEETHKFESRYNASLVGPYPEARDIYRERSPLHYVHQVSCPVIVLQGLEDKVVPPSQAEAMVAALKKKGIPHEYVTFPDEGHGFRNPENVKAATEAELAFYKKTLGL